MHAGGSPRAGLRLDTVLARRVRAPAARRPAASCSSGQPNVGKSSLLNQLAGDELAIVTPIPGTTRDAIRSDPDRRRSAPRRRHRRPARNDDEVERIGIARTRAAIDRADLALLVTDARATQHPGDAAIIARLDASLPRVIVRNKIDLAGVEPRRATFNDAPEIWLSAKNGSGVDLLRKAILDLAGAGEDTHDAFLARERHMRALQAAQEHLAFSTTHLGPPPALELCAEELRQAHDALGEITGAHTSDDLLGVIFSRFCIGK